VNNFNVSFIFVTRVHLIRKETIEEFARKNAQSRTSLNEWLTKVRFADWNTPPRYAGHFWECGPAGK
jgi:mRNA interferase HigB